MKTVKMISSEYGYNDVNGINDTEITLYAQGETYTVGEGLASALVNMGAAEIVDLEEEKSSEAPENKGKKKAPENKGK